MSKIVKPVALNETLVETNNKLTTIDNDLKTQAGNIRSSLNTIGSNINSLVKEESFLSILDVLSSIRSINGLRGDVVLTGSDIKINSSSVKTVAQYASELNQAISNTPLTFATQNISGNDYMLVVTVGTPS